MLDRVISRGQMRDELIQITRMLMKLPPAVKGDLPAPSNESDAADTPAQDEAEK